MAGVPNSTAFTLVSIDPIWLLQSCLPFQLMKNYKPKERFHSENLKDGADRMQTGICSHFHIPMVIFHKYLGI